MKHLAIVIFLFFTLATQAAKVDQSVEITVNGETRSYWLYVPTKVKSPAPLVFSLHGTSGHSTDKSPFRTAVADTAGCIVVYPQGEDMTFPAFGNAVLPGWHSIGETSKDIDFFRAIIEAVAGQYTIDRSRIYCCGFSNGGMMTYTVANVMGDTFAAFSSISGFPLNEFHLHHTGYRPVPFLHIHGKADDFVKYSLVPTIVDDMVARTGANPVPEKKSVSGRYDRSIYAATEGGFPYVFYEINDMGHSDFTDRTAEGNSAVTMWRFMRQYTLDSPCDTTLKWRPNIEAEGWTPSDHGFGLYSSTTLVTFGKDQQTDANQNVYHSLQFENGTYRLHFHTEGPEGHQVTVRLQPLTGNRAYVLNQKVDCNGDVNLLFTVTAGWGEYKLSLMRQNTTDDIRITNLEIHSATQEDITAVSSPALPFSQGPSYLLSGLRAPANYRGLTITDGRKVLR